MTKQSRTLSQETGLPRYARNDDKRKNRMKKLLLLALLTPLLSGCGIVRAGANITKKVVTVPVKVLTLTETEESNVDYSITAKTEKNSHYRIYK